MGTRYFFRYKKAKNLVFDFLPRKALDGGLGGFSTKKKHFRKLSFPPVPLWLECTWDGPNHSPCHSDE